MSHSHHPRSVTDQASATRIDCSPYNSPERQRRNLQPSDREMNRLCCFLTPPIGVLAFHGGLEQFVVKAVAHEIEGQRETLRF